MYSGIRTGRNETAQNVKGKADSWREEHLAVIAFICQEFFRLMEQVEHSIFLPCAAVDLVASFYLGGLQVPFDCAQGKQPAPAFRSETALQSSFNALS